MVLGNPIVNVLETMSELDAILHLDLRVAVTTLNDIKSSIESRFPILSALAHQWDEVNSLARHPCNGNPLRCPRCFSWLMNT